MYLMHGDKPVLQFQLDDMYLKVIDNDFLPYALRDYIKDSDFSSKESIVRLSEHIASLKDYLCSRTLSLSRENVKAILHSVALPQRLNTADMLKIVFSCDGLSMTDNYWLKEEQDSRTFSEVNLRNHRLKDAAYEISLLGRSVSATKAIMQPDISTDGMFAKTWVRKDDGIELWKTCRSSDFINAVVEKEASDILDHSNVKHVRYELFEKDGLKITSCRCLANDEVSLVNGYEIKDWCTHTGKGFIDFVESSFLTDFAKMCVTDYVIGNTDRHLGNVQFLVDNNSGKIKEMAPLFDHNQALICDRINGLDESLIYDPTGLSMRESALKYYTLSYILFDENYLPEKASKRFESLIEGTHVTPKNKLKR